MTVGLLESLKPIERGEAELTREQCCRWLRVKDPELLEHLYRAAYKVKCREVGPVVQLRGLIEISNYCLRDCLYCGIRKSNAKTRRYALSIDEIIESAGVAASFRYGSIVLQGGERNDKEFTELINSALRDFENYVKFNRNINTKYYQAYYTLDGFDQLLKNNIDFISIKNKYVNNSEKGLSMYDWIGPQSKLDAT